MKAIKIIEEMCYSSNCEGFGVMHCFDEECTTMPYLWGFFGQVHTQVGKLEQGNYLYLYKSSNEYEILHLCKCGAPNVELHTKEGEDICLWKIE